MAIIISLTDFAQVTQPFDPNETVTITASAGDLNQLSIAQIGRMNDFNVDILECTGNSFVWVVAQAKAFAATNIRFSTDDTPHLFDTTANLASLSEVEIQALVAKGLDVVRTSDDNNGNPQQIYDAAQFKAWGNVAFEAGDTIIVADTGDSLSTLTPTELQRLDKIDATGDNVLSLSAAQFAVLTADKFTAGDVLILRDTAAVLQGLDNNAIQALAAKGVVRIDCAPENAFSLSIGQSQALLETTISLSGGDTVTLVGSVTPLSTFLTPETIENLGDLGVKVIDTDENLMAISVDHAVALLRAGIAFADNDSVALIDWGTTLDDLLPGQIGALEDIGIKAIDAVDDALTLGVEQAGALAGTGINLNANDNVVIADDGANFQFLSAAQIAALATKGVDAFRSLSPVNPLALTLEQFNALGGIALSAVNDIKVMASGEAFAALTPEQFATFAAKEVDIIDADGTLALKVAQFNALGTVGFAAGDTVILRDSAEALRALDASAIQRLADKGVARIESDGAAFSLSVDAAAVLAGTAITLSADNTVTVTGPAGDLQLTPVQIGQLAAKGVDVIDAAGDNAVLNLSFAQAVALAATETMKLAAGDRVSLLADAADLRNLSDVQITKLGQKGVDVIDAAGDNAVLNLSFAQAVALAATETMKLAAGDRVTLLATALDLRQNLSGDQITKLGQKGVDVIDAMGNNIALALSFDQARALADTAIVLAADDDVSLTVTLAEVQTLTGAQITALLAKGVDHINITNPTNETLYLTLAQLDSLVGIDLSTIENIVLRDRGAVLGSLSPDRIAQLASQGVDSVDAGNDILVLSVGQLNALGMVGLEMEDSVTLLDTSAWLVELTGDQIRALDTRGVDRINVLDDEWKMTIAQAKALAATEIGLFATDDVILSGTAAELATLTAADITALGGKSLDMIDVSGNALTLDVDQAAALAGTASLKFSAGDVVTVSGTGAALATLTATQIAALSAKGVDAVDASDNSINFSLSQFNALGALNLDANDAIKVQGTAAADVFTGKGNNEAFFGSGGNDVLRGNGGDDTLYGGAGKDALTGGAGKDIFVFNTATNRLTNLDQITDFNVRDDGIWLDNAVFRKLGSTGSALNPAKLNKAFFVIGSVAKDRNDYLIYDNKKGVLYYDADGSGAGRAIEIAKLAKNLKMSAADFFVV